MSGGRFKVRLTVITTKPWIWAIIKCEPWTKVSFGIKCFLERQQGLFSQSPASDEEQTKREAEGQPMSGHSRVGLEWGQYFYLFIFFNQSRTAGKNLSLVCIFFCTQWNTIPLLWWLFRPLTRRWKWWQVSTAIWQSFYKGQSLFSYFYKSNTVIYWYLFQTITRNRSIPPTWPLMVMIPAFKQF